MDKNHHNTHPTPEGVPGRTPELPVEQVERLQALAGLLSELVHANRFEAQQDDEGWFDLRAVRPNMQCRTKCYRLGVTFQQGSEWLAFVRSFRANRASLRQVSCTFLCGWGTGW